MTRKHFEALADALQSTGASDETILAVIAVCEDASPRFNRRLFLSACGIDPREVA